jgi:hypothetical protein
MERNFDRNESKTIELEESAHTNNALQFIAA